MNVLKVIALAEIRHAELLEQAEQHRLAQRAAHSHRGRKQWRNTLRNELTMLRARVSATRRRRDAMTPTNVAPAAEAPVNAAGATSA